MRSLGATLPNLPSLAAPQLSTRLSATSILIQPTRPPLTPKSARSSLQCSVHTLSLGVAHPRSAEMDGRCIVSGSVYLCLSGPGVVGRRVRGISNYGLSLSPLRPCVSRRRSRNPGFAGKKRPRGCCRPLNSIKLSILLAALDSPLSWPSLVKFCPRRK